LKPKPKQEKSKLQQERTDAIRAFWAEGKPAKFFEAYQAQDLIDAGIPKPDLVKCGLIKTESSGQLKDLDKPTTLRKCADIMSEAYGEFIAPMRISRAFTDKGAPGRKTNGQIVPSELMRWWDEHERKDGGEQGSLISEARKAELERKIDEARKARLEADEIERANSDKWMLVEYHNASMQRAGGIAWARFSAIIEKELPSAHEQKLRQANLTPEQFTEIMVHIRSSHLAAVDALQKEMEKLA